MAHTHDGWIVYTPSYPPFGLMDIKCDQNTASNNGQTLKRTSTLNNYWPLHRADMRFAYGVDETSAAQNRDSIVVTEQTSGLFALGANFNDIDGNVYTVIGLRQERFRVRNLK